MQVVAASGAAWRWTSSDAATLRRCAAAEVASGRGADLLFVLLRPGAPAEVVHRPLWASRLPRLPGV